VNSSRNLSIVSTGGSQLYVLAKPATMRHMVSTLGSRRFGLGLFVFFLSLRPPAKEDPRGQSNVERAFSIDALLAVGVNAATVSAPFQPGAHGCTSWQTVRRCCTWCLHWARGAWVWA
jgi:hypothetical protein